jgi:hypothetical protein
MKPLEVFVFSVTATAIRRRKKKRIRTRPTVSGRSTAPATTWNSCGC